MACIDIVTTDSSVVGWWVMFCEVVGAILGRWFPLEMEICVCLLILQPIVPHVDGFGASLLDGLVSETNRGSIVQCYRCGGLRIPHFFKRNADGNGLPTVDKGSSNFGVSCRGGHMFQNVGGIEDSAVEEVGTIGVVSQEEVAT